MALSDLLTGYGGKTFPLPEIAGCYKGRSLIICGDAACIWSDLEAFGCKYTLGRGAVYKSGWQFLTINKLVETFPGDIEHCYSNEAELLHKFVSARRVEYSREFGSPKHLHSCSKGAQWRWPWSGRGTSALGSVLVGLGLGYDQIVLAGVPLDNGPHNGEPSWRKSCFQEEARDHSHWENAIPHFEGKVKSLSGRTREWLGSPK